MLFASIFLVAIASVTDVRTAITDTFSCLVDKARGTASGSCASGDRSGMSNFEIGTKDGRYYDVYSAGKTIGDGWTVTSGTVDIHSAKFKFLNGTATDHIDLDGDTPGSMAKTIPTIIGQEYTVTFDYARNPYGSQDRKFTFSDGKNATQITATSTSAWTNKTITFKATSNSTTLSFTSNTPSGEAGNLGALLDNIKIQAK